MVKKATGLQRIINATKYSLKGFKSAIINEAAFRQELILLILAYVIVMLIDFSIYERILLVGSIGFVMIVELINSAIECVVDRIGSERHELSGRAKDYGSAAVFLSLLLTLILWIYLFACHFFP
ncbi:MULTISPECIES: diacylglycerol kinase [unclassified Gilliamella]|uniref:diacylglycerol kinase n=1 Tax=unclassified Gilliamella TaxID=2685620 RepID=UPI0009BD7C35|nr:diacylglycerol kinase [Gilliamella sp. B3482]MCX8586863.1 diacylglycerol kinase [Gilliamella sp. B3562]MCX8597639.1 diacylglycerol kinase [Gilliamella sp. B3493]MCX8600229.1 diacylglycerol kinase [Gilliamella sp. B3486]MCX8663703.1 diacylglycerol kinase [Gilliamella sp. B2911]MCX8674761.1 diacylglycerol kinase [Gilliamella sp. B3023]MCX8686512.1 diacylglycerol kinase [Gilliamella sp. B2864]MCX8690496.1 diacylglycerol kinase [Gilliamella sp. B2973]MCX8706209.1 diacylglycerol kinase [Gilli